MSTDKSGCRHFISFPVESLISSGRPFAGKVHGPAHLRNSLHLPQSEKYTNSSKHFTKMKHLLEERKNGSATSLIGCNVQWFIS